VARKYGTTIRPVYARLNGQNLELADKLVQTYQGYVGRTKGELEEATSGLERKGYDYRFVRGLAALLDRRCEFECRSVVDPVEARRAVFQLAAEQGVPTTEEDRQQILQEAANELDVEPEMLEQSLYGDLEAEQILCRFRPLAAEHLLKRYNLSLTQTLLFRSTEMEFTASGNWQSIFRAIKWLGLIYTIEKRDDQFWVRVDGPVSLFKLNRRYGTSLAKLLPHIVANPEWRVQAKILHRKSDRRLLDLTLDSRRHGAYLEPARVLQEALYDSVVEQDFAQRFEAMEAGWTLTREPDPIPVGRQVMIPDFRFQKESVQVYLEIAGFWTPRYLQHKLRQLSSVRDLDMIVAADQKLACKKLDKIGRKLRVVYYKDQVPLKPILDHLREREKRLVEQQVKRLRADGVKVEAPVVTAEDLAATLGVVEEAAKQLLREESFPGYRVVGDMLIKPAMLERIAMELEKREDAGQLTLPQAAKIITALGGRRATAILEALGYSIQWQGIDPNKATIQKRRQG
jgi:predicted nuclease of restriction endonuclease-like RecB superfamily